MSKDITGTPKLSYDRNDFVCPDIVIDKVCEQSKYFTSVDDMKIYGVHPEFRDQFFSVVIDVISSIPPPTRKCRHVQ